MALREDGRGIEGGWAWHCYVRTILLIKESIHFYLRVGGLITTAMELPIKTTLQVPMYSLMDLCSIATFYVYCCGSTIYSGTSIIGSPYVAATSPIKTTL